MQAIIAVSGVVIRKNKVLMLRRASHKVHAGAWETVSGRVEIGEDPYAAICREIAEESGLSVQVERRPIDAYQAMRGEAPMFVVIYRAESHEGTVQLSHEHDAHEWLSPEEAKSKLTFPRLYQAIERCFEAPPYR